jgi:hypothetical protein
VQKKRELIVRCISRQTKRQRSSYG